MYIPIGRMHTVLSLKLDSNSSALSVSGGVHLVSPSDLERSRYVVANNPRVGYSKNKLQNCIALFANHFDVPVPVSRHPPGHGSPALLRLLLAPVSPVLLRLLLAPVRRQQVKANCLDPRGQLPDEYLPEWAMPATPPQDHDVADLAFELRRDSNPEPPRAHRAMHWTPHRSKRIRHALNKCLQVLANDCECLRVLASACECLRVLASACAYI